MKFCIFSYKVKRIHSKVYIESFNKNRATERQEDFTRFYHHYYSSFCFFANRFIKDHHEAEDIVSEVAVRVWVKLDGIEHEGALKNYFYTSIRHACLRALENRKRRETKEKEYSLEQVSEPSTGLEYLAYTEMLERVEFLLNKLPSHCRQVFTKLYVEGKTEKEAAEELQVSINTIKFHRKRGLKLLRGSAMVLISILIARLF
jgi:RNA polymerase sigma-70 factor (family 1)